MFEVGKTSKAHPCRLAVVRLPSGTWICANSPSDKCYQYCEVYLVACPDPDKGWFDRTKYIRKAQSWRSRNKEKVENGNGNKS